MTVKIEALVEGEWQPHRYANMFLREPTTGPERLRIGPRDRHSQLLLGLAAEIAPPYKLLYVLHTPGTAAIAARYESPALDRREVEELFGRFAAFFAGDGRHDVWLHSGPDEATLVWERHDLLYAYGPLERFETVLLRYGLRRGGPLAIPSPHSHRYHDEWDEAEGALVQFLQWRITSLRPEDEQ